MKLVDFDVYKELLKEKSGLVLSPDKSYLLESRLTPISKKWGFDDLEAMTKSLNGVPDKNMIIDIIEAMTTNETSFFRDMRPFDLFRDETLPYMLETRVNKRRLNIWCAAASSGQEPYSLSMIIKEMGAAFSGWNINILGTDISNEILDQARNGVYSQFEVQRGLPIQMLMKYFTQQDDQKWQINDDIKKTVKYEYFNLLDSMASLGRFDIIFCRNVLIYFDEATKADILERMSAIIEDDGIVFLGGAETVLGITDAFKPVPNKRGIYAKPDSIHFQTNAASASVAGA